MKTEDIDKKIGMPDVDEEWAKFEREVLGVEETKSRKRVFVGWTIGIAASIALLAGIFLWVNGAEKLTDSSEVVAQVTNTQTEVKNNVANDDETQEEATDKSQSDAVAEESRTDNPTRNLIAMGTPRSNDKVANPQSDNRVGTSPSNDNQNAQTPAIENKTEEKVFSVEEQQPSFRGGDRGLQEFIKQNLKYPSMAQAYGVSGRVIMQFKIDSLGYISDVKAAKHLLRYDTLLLSRESEARQIELKEQIPQQLEEECARVIALMPRWSPAKISGKVVSMKYNLPFMFQPSEMLKTE
jgi:hypothetical protein